VKKKKGFRARARWRRFTRRCRIRIANGKVALAPGEGEITINTKFKPKSVYLRLGKQQNIPGCSQLEDTVEVISLQDRGFTVAYKIQTGPRTFRWVARG
jgi:hypothetical protein